MLTLEAAWRYGSLEQLGIVRTSEASRQAELRNAIATALGAENPQHYVDANQVFDAAGQWAATSAGDTVGRRQSVNQKLAVRLLEKRGHHVMVAENGREHLTPWSRDLST